MSKKHINKNVLLISPQPFFQWRGTPIRVKVIVQTLAKLGYFVDLLTLPIGEKITPEGVNVIRVPNPFKVKYIPIGPSWHKGFFDLLIFLKGLQLISNKKYSVIHGIEDGGVIAAILSHGNISQAIFEKHSDPFSYKKGRIKNVGLLLYSYIEQKSIKNVKAVICTGPGLVEQVKLMNTNKKVYHISDIASSLKEPSLKQVLDTRDELLHPKDELLISFVGSFATYQGIELLMRTISEVLVQITKVRFVLIGGTDKEIAKWKTIFKQQGVIESIDFMGMISPYLVSVILAASDILLSPRISGLNSPLKLIDYLKAGRAIVATNVYANKVILNDDVAILTNPDPTSMSHAIITLIENTRRREIMGQECLKLYEKKYNFENFMVNLKDCYNSVQT